MDEHQAGRGAWLLRHHKALILTLGNGDLEDVPGWGGVLFVACVQQFWLSLQEHHSGLRRRRTGGARAHPGLVTELVPLEALGEGVAHATGGAAVGLVGQVGFEVAPQLGGQCVSTATLGAREGPLPRVQALVSAQCMWVSEGLPTHGAQVGLPGVGDEMAPQFWQLREGVGTVRAAVRALPRVQPQVPTQVAPLAERSATVWAQEGLFTCVEPHVVPQGALAGQGPPTHGARARGWGSWHLVGLAMQPQGGPAGKGLATLVTSKGSGT